MDQLFLRRMSRTDRSLLNYSSTLISSAIFSVVLASLSGCLIKGKKASISNNAPVNPIHFFGVMKDQSGVGISGGKVFFHKDSLPISITDSTGNFDFTIPRKLIDIRSVEEMNIFGESSTTTSSSGFFLYFMSAAGGVLQGSISGKAEGAVSRKFQFIEQGDVDLGEITLKPLGAVIGGVSEIDEDGQLVPTGDALVSIGAVSTRSDANGRFQLLGVAPGSHEVQAISNSRSLANRMSVTVGSGSGSGGNETELVSPLVVFKRGVVDGALRKAPKKEFTKSQPSGHPFLETFLLSVSPLVVKMRVSHDKQSLAQKEWVGATSVISYPFPKNGDFSLYVELAGRGSAQEPQILSVPVTVGGFVTDGALVIGDGSGTITSLAVQLSIRVPPGATKMRLVTQESQLNTRSPTTSYREPRSTVDYVFPSGSKGNLTLFCQFFFADDASLVVAASAAFIPFPSSDVPPFLIESGAEVSPYRVVRLDIVVPPNAIEMKISTSSASSGSSGSGRSSGGFSFGGFGSSSGSSAAGWISVSPVQFHVFAKDGMQKLFLRFRDVDRNESPAYGQAIRVLPFDPSGVGFFIGSDTGVNNSRELDVNLIPPYGATSFRIWEGDVAPRNDWSTLIPNFTYVVSGGPGLRTIKVQYKNIDQDISLVYTQQLRVQPFVDDGGIFTLNQGSPATSSPEVTLSISPPASALEMAISEGSPPLVGTALWVPVASSYSLQLQSRGSKDIYLIFRTISGETSSTLRRTILYEPFPVGVGGFTINNGAAVTDNPEVVLEITPPPGATEVKVGQGPSGIEFAGYQALQASVSLRLPEIDGIVTVLVKFRNQNGEESVTMAHQIKVELFPALNLTATLNGGVSPTASSLIMIDFNPPSLGGLVRISESFNGLFSTPAVSTTVAVPFTLSATLGIKTIYFQFLSPAGKSSPVFSETIVLQ